jgi:hypothetical protein
MNAISDARDVIVAALEPVLPGRVNGYATTRIQRGVAPYIWLEAPSTAPETLGETATFWVASFPVRIVVDGASHAQIALLDELVAKTIDAVEAEPLLDARSAEPEDVFIDSNHVLRGATVTVAATITTRTFCPPIVTPATVPPEPAPIGA